ncbi:MAG: hypothetical protein WKF97_12395 [Chitinophagaceae bacterium]
MKRIILLLPLFSGLFLSCDMNDNASSKEAATVKFYGLLEQQGITTYQYGTHTISNGSQTYALKSSTVNLDKYTGKNVTIKGTKVDGFPLENGPDFIDVLTVE